MPFDEFWCGHGTGIESFTKLGDSIYFRDATSVYVNMFRSSVLRPTTRRTCGSRRRPTCRTTDTVTFTVDGARRRRAWPTARPCGCASRVGRRRRRRSSSTAQTSDVAALPRPATSSLPRSTPATRSRTRCRPKVAVDDATENPNWVAFTYGPVLLGDRAQPQQRRRHATSPACSCAWATADKSAQRRTSIVDDAAAWKAGIEEQPRAHARTAPNANGTTTMRFALQERRRARPRRSPSSRTTASTTPATRPT